MVKNYPNLFPTTLDLDDLEDIVYTSNQILTNLIVDTERKLNYIKNNTNTLINDALGEYELEAGEPIKKISTSDSEVYEQLYEALIGMYSQEISL